MENHGEGKLHYGEPEWHQAAWDWAAWAISKKFLWIWFSTDGFPIGGIIIRPIPAFDDSIYKFERITEHQDGSPIAWVDFLWAPGLYNIVIPFLKSLGYERIGWQRRDINTIHIVEMAKLRSKAVLPTNLVLERSSHQTKPLPRLEHRPLS